jgi:Zn-dependent protease with chaperone function
MSETTGDVRALPIVLASLAPNGSTPPQDPVQTTRVGDRIRQYIRACSIELAVHSSILLFVLLPLYMLAVPAYLSDAAIVNGYIATRQIALRFGQAGLPAVEELRFRGHAFEEAALAATLLIFVFGVALYHRNLRMRLSQVAIGVPSIRDGRRYRLLPGRYSTVLETAIAAIWRSAEPVKSPPRLYCFAASSVVACAVADGDFAAVAVSTGLLERCADDVDDFTKLILRHELGHIFAGDERRLPKAESMIYVVRKLIVWLLVIVLVMGGLQVATTKIEQGWVGVSLSSFAVPLWAVLSPILFTYLGLIVLSRYVSLIFMLTELRADLNACLIDADLARFVRVVSQCGSVPKSDWKGSMRSLFGTELSHLSPTERLEILKSSDRLLTPKLRYFGLSLVLPLLLMVLGIGGIGASSQQATEAFRWIMSVGLTGVVASLNISLAFTLLNAGIGRGQRLSAKRTVGLAMAAILANSVLFLNEYRFVNGMSEWITSILFMNTPEIGGSFHGKTVAVLKIFAHPLGGPARDGRLLLWLCSLSIIFFGFPRLVPRVAERYLYSVVGFLIVLGTVWERGSVNDIPFFSVAWLLELGGGWAARTATWCGPTLSFVLIVPVLFLGALLLRPIYIRDA